MILNTETDPAHNGVDLSFYDASGKAADRLQYAGVDHGRFLEIIPIIIVHTLGNDKCKPIIDALFAIGKNSLDWKNRKACWFPASREALVDYFTPYNHFSKDTQQESKLKNVGRKIASLKKVQADAGVVLVDCREVLEPDMNKRRKRKNLPSEYRLPIFEYAMEAYQRAQNDRDRYKPVGPGSIWKNAALEVSVEIKRGASPPPKPKSQQTLEQMRKVIIGYIRKFAHVRYEQGCDYGFVLGEIADLTHRAIGGGYRQI